MSDTQDNSANTSHDPTVMFYDYDYPWPEDPFFSYVVPGKVGFHSTANDISFLNQGAASIESKTVLDLCCGTGRLSMPHAREGRSVTGVDLSQGQIDRAHVRLKKEPEDVQKRIKFITGNVVGLDLKQEFDFVQIGFNSLSAIADPKAQEEAVMTIARHLRKGGLTVIDIQNPLLVKAETDSIPRIIYEKTERENAFRYTKSAWVTQVDTYMGVTEQGWYDVIGEDESLKRYPYTMKIRYISLREMELLLEKAGLKLGSMCGDHFGSPFEPYSPKMIFIAVKT